MLRDYLCTPLLIIEDCYKMPFSDLFPGPQTSESIRYLNRDGELLKEVMLRI